MFRQHLEQNPGIKDWQISGTVMRKMELLRLRVKDISFEYRNIFVRDAHGLSRGVPPRRR